MSGSDVLGDLIRDLASSRGPRSSDWEAWRVRARAAVVASNPGRLAELEGLLGGPASAIPRLAPRPAAGAISPPGTATIPWPANKDRLVAFLESLKTGPPTADARGAGPGFKPTPWVFISSAFGEAEIYRERARSACLRKRMLPVAMESWSAASRPVAEVCREYIEQCDVVVLILLHRYGAIEPQSGKSYTELEYEHARASRKDVLAFEVTSVPAAVEPTRIDPEDLRRLQAFSAGLRPSLRGRAGTPADLELAVLQGLDDWKGSLASR